MSNESIKCQITSFIRRLVTLSMIAIIAVMLNSYVVSICYADGNSMFPTIENNEILLVNRASPKLNNGDIVLIHVTLENTGIEYIVKRIVASSGESVVINYVDNTVSVDGRILPEPYINRLEKDPMEDSNGNCIIEFNVPEGCYFVLGDNRNHSSDSRDEKIGFIHQDEIVGEIHKICK